MTTPTIEAASAISKPMVLNRNALAGESSLDIKLATLRHEMVSFNFEAQMKFFIKEVLKLVNIKKKGYNVT